MPLPLPDLDTRRWSDLVEEATALIPRFAPGWTDHNVHDPGVMVLELLAWLTEQDVYRANRVPERHVRKFLSLLGYSPLPPRPAETYLTFAHEQPDANPVDLPAGTRLLSGGLPFRTAAPLTACALGILVVQSFDGTAFADLSRAWRDRARVRPWGADPDAEREPAFYLGFDRELPVGVPISLWLAVDAPPGEPEEHHTIRTVWEYWDGVDWHELDASAGEVADATRALTRPGPVVCTLPGPAVAVCRGANPDQASYLRCRLAEGRPDAAPELLDVAVNAVLVEQQNDVKAALLGAGEARPGQRVKLPEAPVAGAVVSLRTGSGADQREWRQRLDFDASTRMDPDFVLDATTGVIGFGDGERGEVVPAGDPIVADYQATAAERGNLVAGSEWSLAVPPSDTPLRITNRAALSGGQAAETVAHASGRAAETLWAHERIAELSSPEGTLDQLDRAEVLARKPPERATTLLDFERIALEVPGTNVARVRAWANLDARLPGLLAPGTVSLVVVPHLPVGEPRPTLGLLRAVRCHLEKRRVICTRLVVAGPRYVRVSVRARVRVETGYEHASVRAEVDAALNGFLDPLTGGPAGRGWPFGRDVYRTEVLQVMAAVPGVRHVTELELSADGEPAQCGNLCVPAISLAAPGTHTIDVEAEGR